MRLDNKKLLLLLAMKNMSIAEVVEKSGLSRGTVSAVKAGKSCTYITIGKLAKALDVPVQDLIEE